MRHDIDPVYIWLVKQFLRILYGNYSRHGLRIEAHRTSQAYKSKLVLYNLLLSLY